MKRHETCWEEKISDKVMCGMQVSGYRVGENLQSVGSIGEKPPVQQNASPIIFSKGVEVGKELSMSAAHSNIARLVTKNENGATGIGNIINKEGEKAI